MANTDFIIQGLTIIGEHGIEEQGYVKVENGKISEMGNIHNLKTDEHNKVYQFSSNHVLIPGMIDVHIHGTNGSDTVDLNHLDCVTARHTEKSRDIHPGIYLCYTKLQ